jgi:single-strand DNA-binding protein
MIIVEIAGHLGADPEVRFTASGQKVTTLRVATNSRRQGKDETVWWRLTIFGDRFDKMLSYFKKGSAIIAIGEMNPPSIWTDKDGKSHVQLELIAEIIRFSPFGKSERSDATPGAYQAQNNHGGAGGGGSGGGRYQPAEHAYSEPSYGAPPQQHSTPQSPNLSTAGKFDGGFSSYSSNTHEDDGIPF